MVVALRVYDAGGTSHCRDMPYGLLLDNQVFRDSLRALEASRLTQPSRTASSEAGIYRRTTD
jgi:hypothetical protein